MKIRKKLFDECLFSCIRQRTLTNPFKSLPFLVGCYANKKRKHHYEIQKAERELRSAVKKILVLLYFDGL